jgi:hypothetical protein
VRKIGGSGVLPRKAFIFLMLNDSISGIFWSIHNEKKNTLSKNSLLAKAI